MYLEALGMPGLSACSSFYRIGKLGRGETIFISSAAGEVGQLVGQLAKREGADCDWECWERGEGLYFEGARV